MSLLRRRMLLAASMQSGGGKIDNFVSIVQSGTRYDIIFEYPCDVPITVRLLNYDTGAIFVPAGTSSYSLGKTPLAPHIIDVEPKSDSIYNYTW